MKRYIYEIKNNLTGETYIGKHTQKEECDSYMGSGVLLKEAQKEYGKENFTRTILVEGDFSDTELADLEVQYIKKYKSQGKAEYNTSLISLGGDTSLFIDYNKVSDSLHELYQNNPQKLKELKDRAKIYSKITPKYGEENGMYGKSHSEETKKLLSDSHKGNKNNQYGKHWYTNGENNISAFDCPEGYWRGVTLSEEERYKKGNIRGKHHYNNGEIEILAFECPEGFTKGKLKREYGTSR